jgi:hypothetical protein
MQPTMQLVLTLAMAGLALAAGKPLTSPTTTLVTTTASSTTTTPGPWTPGPLAPYVPGPQNCDGELQCLNWLGPYELWCEYINTIGHAGIAFSMLGTSCPPASTATTTA